MGTSRRRIAALGAAALLALGTTSCSDDGSTAGASIVQASGDRAAADPADAERGGAVTRRVAASLWDPFVLEAADGNLAYSPASITLALGMVRAGAEGTSAEQLDDLLGTTDPAQLHRALNGLSAHLADQDGPATTQGGEAKEIELRSANSLWGQDGVAWEDPFLDLLQREYGTGIHVVDYVEDADGAQDQVNGWVAEQTEDQITDLIPDDLFTDATRLTLVNALYLAAPWDHELTEHGDRPFTTLAGDEVSVPTMHASSLYPYQAGDGWQAVTLPYAGGELAMTLLVPDAGKLGAVEQALDADLLEQVLTGGTDEVVDLTLPRFAIDSRPSLGAALQTIGLSEPFQTERDFLPMTADPKAQPLRLADAVHQATVEVDEHGTVAAAATAAVFEKVGAAIGGVELVVDRPFLFAIHDVATATPLFLGRVADPRGGS